MNTKGSYYDGPRLRPLRCMVRLHDWVHMRDTGKTCYEICSCCGERRVWQRQGGYQWIDWQWLMTGEWTNSRRSGC